MYTAIVVFHMLACFALILIVLLQTGRGAEMGAAFGGASQTLFGGSGGSTFMSKLTTAAAIVFMVTCLGLTYFSAGPPTKSIMEDVKAEKPQGPALPEAKPVQPAPAQSATTETTTQPQPGSDAASAEKAAPQPAPAVAEPAKSEAREPTKPDPAAKAEKPAKAAPAAAKQPEKAPAAGSNKK